MLYRICSAGHSAALGYALRILKEEGCVILPCPDKTATHLLLPVPSFGPDGQLVGGGDLEAVLSHLPKSVTVIGGNLNNPLLNGYHTIDLLQNPSYVAENASITAYCAVGLAEKRLPVIWKHLPVMVIGWGRIGKCLALLLQQMGARVTVAARKEADRALADALGYQAVPTEGLSTNGYRVVFNTAPEMIVPDCRGEGLYMDLASKPGLGGDNVVVARGLPGKLAPESSGRLIAHHVLTILNKELDL